LRVDADRLRDLGLRGGHRADLRDVQRRAGAVDPRRLPRRGLLSRRRRACAAVAVPISEPSSAEQVQWILADSGAVACFVETPAHAAVVAGVRDRAPALTHVWQIEVGGKPVGAGEALTA